jgi:hypothetical protein
MRGRGPRYVTRTVVDERTELRDGQLLKVTVLATPRRARVQRKAA